MSTFITMYTKEYGKLELNYSEWDDFIGSKVTYHRIDGPAIKWASGQLVWYYEGKLHRIDGPAIEDHHEHMTWYIDGILLTKSQFDQTIQEVKDIDIVMRLIDPRRWVREYEV